MFFVTKNSAILLQLSKSAIFSAENGCLIYSQSLKLTLHIQFCNLVVFLVPCLPKIVAREMNKEIDLKMVVFLSLNICTHIFWSYIAFFFNFRVLWLWPPYLKAIYTLSLPLSLSIFLSIYLFLSLSLYWEKMGGANWTLIYLWMV